MATTIRARIATAAVAAAVAVTGFAPPAQAGILDALATGLSFSAGDFTDYHKPMSSAPRHTTPSGNEGTTPMALREDTETTSEIDLILRDSPKAKGTRTDAVNATNIWPDKRSASKANQVLARINAHRKAQKKQPLQLDNTMSAGAQQYADKLARTKIIKHDPGMYKYAEILAMRATTNDDTVAEGLVRQWANSPAHRELMERDSFTTAGVGIAYDDQAGQVFAVVRLYY